VPSQAFAFGGSNKPLIGQPSQPQVAAAPGSTSQEAVPVEAAAAAVTLYAGYTMRDCSPQDVVPFSAPMAATTPAVPADEADEEVVNMSPSNTARRRTRNSSTTAAAAGHKRQRKAYAALSGPPKGLPGKLGGAPLRLILARFTIDFGRIQSTCHVPDRELRRRMKTQ
jgi:hypothetical protein